MTAPASPPRHEITDAVIIAGGIDLSVVTNKGERLTARVRLLPVACYPVFFSTLDDEHKLAEFVCDKPPGWAEALAAPSLLDVAECAMDLNFQSACRWAARRARSAEVAKHLEQVTVTILSQLSALFAPARASSSPGAPAK